MWAAVVAGVFIAGADYAYQRRQVMKQLKMSMFEIKQEHKQSEGDPQVKAAIRQKQMAMSRNRMLSNVATADVVLVNPTHLAVALKYQVGAGAPRVVAKGAGAIALKIREQAQEARVPVVEDKPLCRVIYRSVELEEEIPAELYAAVARDPRVRHGGRPAAAHRRRPPADDHGAGAGAARPRRAAGPAGARRCGPPARATAVDGATPATSLSAGRVRVR